MADRSPSKGRLLDAAWDAVEDEDYVRARALVERHIAAHPDDSMGPALLEMVVAIERQDLAAAEEGSVEVPRASAETTILPFHCLSCGHVVRFARRALLNTRGLTFFGFDELNRGASCHVCQVCGLVHWFVESAPGALQLLHPDRSTATPQAEQSDKRGCMVCGFDRCYSRSALVNTAGLTFLGFDFLNREARVLTCFRCGHLHWNFSEGGDWALPRSPFPVPAPPLRREQAHARRSVCLACGGRDLHTRSALLNSRVMTHFGLDFLDAEATLLVCKDCRFARWFLDLPEDS